MKRVYICAPLSDNPNQDVINAVRFGEYAMKECGAAPVVPHFYILMTNPQSDKETEQRKLADFSLIWMIDELWVFGDYWTDEMVEEISRAEMLKIPVRYHRPLQWEKRGSKVHYPGHEAGCTVQRTN